MDMKWNGVECASEWMCILASYDEALGTKYYSSGARALALARRHLIAGTEPSAAFRRRNARVISPRRVEYRAAPPKFHRTARVHAQSANMDTRTRTS